MPFERKDVWKLGEGWSATLLWYARGVRELQKRPITDPTSWRYLAAIHGIDVQLWKDFGYLPAGTVLPPAPERRRLWKQCQHHTWYFLPWHRGYLAAFETIVRSAIVELKGPKDWALPYWNYSDKSEPHARELPTAFSAKTWPDGGPNPLWVVQRYGDGTSPIVIPPEEVDLESALSDTEYAGVKTGGSPGFGGAATPFQHGGDRKAEGKLESLPHDAVHGAVGGQERGSNRKNPKAALPGLMSDPDTAALDPIFWLHHTNIDRLWEVWLRRDAQDTNPTDKAWLTGPAGRKFEMPGPNGKKYVYTAKDMLDMRAPGLNYVYQDVSDPLDGANRLTSRLEFLGAPRSVVATIAETKESMTRRESSQLIGGNGASLRLGGGSVDTRLKLDPAATRKVARSFQKTLLASSTPTEPDRVFLNLENIRGKNDAAIFYVYVNLPRGADPAKHPDNLAGVVSLFGVRKASHEGDAHAGNGISKVLEITKLFDRLHLNDKLDLNHLDVRFVPRNDVRQEDKITVGRVSVYRQGP